MNTTKELHIIGHWVFIAGLVLALILGAIVPGNLAVASVLAIIGVFVGITSITNKEASPFLLATVALAISAGSFKLLPFVGAFFVNILEYVLVLAASGATLVALILIYKLASKG